jgi:hypothetical protein
MTKRVREFRPALPQARVAESSAPGGYFYAGEAARILGLEQIDYQQIRKLFMFVREQAGEPLGTEHKRRWSRFTVTDLACMEALVDLCGGKAALEEGRRLRIEPIRRACRSLRREEGVVNPLLQVPMVRIGDQVFAVVDGTVIHPRSGQLVLEGMIDTVTHHLRGELNLDPELRAAIDAERRRSAHPAAPLRATHLRIR